jgi:hypothetical protein
LMGGIGLYLPRSWGTSSALGAISVVRQNRSHFPFCWGCKVPNKYGVCLALLKFIENYLWIRSKLNREQEIAAILHGVRYLSR